ncbi:MAG: hypothetical protein GY781_04740 [Gammaproteobacteria bacterium]|nr:hypothetical protein [Gammaproteobacteria bacterium]
MTEKLLKAPLFYFIKIQDLNLLLDGWTSVGLLIDVHYLQHILNQGLKRTPLI